jgi:flagellar assembly protein FliH
MASKIVRAGECEGLDTKPIRWRMTGRGACGSEGAAEAQRQGGRDGLANPGGGGGQGDSADFERKLQAEVGRARSEGFQEGQGAGRKAALAEQENLMGQLARSIEMLAGLKPRLRQEAERDVVGLSLAIARRVLRREVQVDREAVLGLVKAAFENTTLREVTEVRVHVDHVMKIREHLKSIGAPEAIEVRADAGLEPGGVVVETKRGSLDASMETQLEEIGNGMADVMGPGRSR